MTKAICAQPQTRTCHCLLSCHAHAQLRRPFVSATSLLLPSWAVRGETEVATSSQEFFAGDAQDLLLTGQGAFEPCTEVTAPLHLSPRTSLLALQTSTAHVTPHTSHFRPDALHLTHDTSLPSHTYTCHLTPHTSHLTDHSLYF